MCHVLLIKSQATCSWNGKAHFCSQQSGDLALLQSFTLEDNLRRMEKQGTLHDAIVAAEAARQKRKEEDRFPQPSVHLADHPSFANMQRIFHHSKTGPASRKHEGLDHSSTM